MSSQPISLLNEVIDAHGGHDRWGQFKGVASTIITGGMLWGIKAANIISTPRRARSEFRRQWTRVTPFGDPNWTMTWTPEHVEINDSKGAIIAQRDNGRDAFDRSYNAPWDPLNLAYFNGYAMWTYHAVPFVFREHGYEAREIESIEHEGEKLRGLSIRFPESVHSHTREQRFFFGSDGLLLRHDYEVDVWADTPAAHFLSEYVDVNGLKFPRRRSVFGRRPDGRPDLELNLVTIDLSDYTLF
ncbi:MAG: hypothetical protein L0228_02845 [Planctomycetes bacterium]|nr:hypothetical protein [Planctomycetota bacterium]